VGKIGGDEDFADFTFAKQKVDNRGHAGAFNFAAKLVNTLVVGEDPAVRGFPAGTIHLEVCHDYVTFAFETKVDEGIRGEHANGIEHIGIVVAVSHD
jgi:hypothetical protein